MVERAAIPLRLTLLRCCLFVPKERYNVNKK